MSDKIVLVKLKLCAETAKTMRALRKIVNVLSEISIDMPWRTDTKTAMNAAQYLLDHIKWK